MLRVDGYCCELERLKCYRKLQWLLNIENRLIVSGPFYQTITFATTRTGKIMKTALEISAAASIMNELESAYK